MKLKCFLPKSFLFSEELVCSKSFSSIAQTKHQWAFIFITVLKSGKLRQECQLVWGSGEGSLAYGYLLVGLLGVHQSSRSLQKGHPTRPLFTLITFYSFFSKCCSGEFRFYTEIHEDRDSVHNIFQHFPSLSKHCSFSPHCYGLRGGRGNRSTVVPRYPFHKPSICLCLFICLYAYGSVIAFYKAFYQDIPNFCMKGNRLTSLQAPADRRARAIFLIVYDFPPPVNGVC